MVIMTKPILFFLCNILFSQVIFAQSSSFVSVKQERFYLNDQFYYYIGTNYWYGGLLALKKDNQQGIDRLRTELDFLKGIG